MAADSAAAAAVFDLVFVNRGVDPNVDLLSMHSASLIMQKKGFE
jgi:hypothetical protein